MSALSKPISPEQNSSPAAALVSVQKVSAGYGANLVVRDVSFSAHSQQIVAIIGPNGAGKSTLLRAVAGLLKPVTGQVFIDGHNVAGLEADEIVRRGLGFVPQLKDVFPSLTVSENLDMGGYLHRADRNRRRGEVLEMFPLLKDKVHRNARTLSGGERKILAFAKAMMARPKVLLLDEPSAALSPTMVETVWKYIRQLREEGLTIIIVEQKARAVLELADWGYILVSGKNAIDDDANTLLNRQDLGKLFLS